MSAKPGTSRRILIGGLVLLSISAVLTPRAPRASDKKTSETAVAGTDSGNDSASRSNLGPFYDGSDDTDNDNDDFTCHPRRIHLAQGSNVNVNDDDNEHQVDMSVSFSISYDDYTANNCQAAQPMIVFATGFAPPLTVMASPPIQFNYTSDKTPAGQVYQSDFIFHTTIPNLRAGNVQYWYQILVMRKLYNTQQGGEQEKKGLSLSTHHVVAAAGRRSRLRAVTSSTPEKVVLSQTLTYRFRTPPLPGEPTTIALVGDLGQTENSTQTMMQIWRALQNPHSKNKSRLSHLLIAGDMSYADSDPYRWTSWFDRMQPLLQALPVHVAAGNHEIECNSVTNDIFVPYEHYFRNPNRIADAKMTPITDAYRQTLWQGSCSTPSEFQGHYVYGNSFYSYQHGLVHIIVLNSYTDTTAGSVQYQWLLHELENNFDRRRTPWLLVAFHCPLYTTFLGHVDELQAVQMKRAMEPVFVQYGVNLVVSGHDHAYMRTHSMADGLVDSTGASPVYLTAGAGGNREQHASGYRHDDDDTQHEEWVAARSLQDYGYGSVAFANATHAYWEWVRDGISQADFQDQVWFINAHAVHVV